MINNKTAIPAHKIIIFFLLNCSLFTVASVVFCSFDILFTVIWYVAVLSVSFSFTITIIRFSPSFKSSFPVTSISAFSSVGIVVNSKLVLSSFNSAVYVYMSVLNSGVISIPSIFNSFSPKLSCSSVDVSSELSSGVSVVSSDAFLSILIVYVFVVFPSSAVTTTFTVFAPSFNCFTPVPVIFCPL